VEAEKVRASYRDGVLTVRLPKVEAEAEGDQIDVA
jgi:HSP20 family molecular chaperone IbpA